MTPLHQAAYDEAKGIDVAARVRALLDEGADPHSTDAAGDTAFNAAAANSPVTGRLMTKHWLEQALAGKGAYGLNDHSGSHGSTLAQYMAKWLTDDELTGDFARAIANGLKVDVANKSGWTPLMAAAAMGRVRAVEALLPHYCHAALCAQAAEDYTAVYSGHAVTYPRGANAVEIAQARVFQDEGIDEKMGEDLWECMDLIAGAIKA